MIILPYVKMGTMPFGPAKVKRRTQFPKKGDVIYIRSAGPGNIYTNPWIEVRVELVKDNTVFFVSRY